MAARLLLIQIVLGASLAGSLSMDSPPLPPHDDTVATATPTPTSTPTAATLAIVNMTQAFSPPPVAVMMPIQSAHNQTRVTAHVTHYWPNWDEFWPGDTGPNCLIFDWSKRWCISPTASGIPWEAVTGFGAACPFDWPLGSVVVIYGLGAFVCLDRGSMVCTPDGVCDVDILTTSDVDGMYIADVFRTWR